MGFSIQDYLKKINRSLTWLDCLSLLISTLFLLLLLAFLYMRQKEGFMPVSYEVAVQGESPSFLKEETRPFASISGKTYTFSWCSGSGRITEKNKIYFTSETQAIASGRTLSKLCQR